MKKIIRFVGGPPGTGKSTYAPHIVRRVQECVEMPVCLMDGDMFFSPAARVRASELSGIELDTGDFARQFNLPAQLRFQQLIRTAADMGLLVVATAPFENMFSIVGGTSLPLWEKMRTQDFASYDIDLTYVLLTGDETEVEEEIRRRLIERGKGNQHQLKLDAKKIADQHYYAKRAELVRQSVKSFGFRLIVDCLADDRDPIAVADRVADAIIASV